jgi:membrane-bound lytic murein transglycosylase D
MRILPALFFAVTISAAAQTPQVPHKLNFADMTLTIRDDARREIQKDVDALTRSPKHFTIKAEKAKTYFPIIEKIFAVEGVPDDFKYLVLQESSLIADAVSSSNAVGFWQFKDFTAIEMGLRVDKEIDERMNIASATRGAARYLKKSNSIFDNWLYTLQSYQMGAGAVMRSEKDLKPGEKHMEITSSTYWYVKKFLSYKIAYQDAVKGKGELEVTAFENKANKRISDLAKELAVDEAELRNYNKWIRADKIPDDRTYVVLVPGTSGVSFETLPSVLAAANLPVAKQQQIVSAIPVEAQTPLLIKINGVNAVQALPGDNAAKIAERVNVDLVRFLEWNDISSSTAIVPGVFYFLGKKRSKAIEDYHTVIAGENLWSVSQKYGVRLKKLKKYNRVEEETLSAGTTVWLSSMRPKTAANTIVTSSVAVLDQSDTFNWEPELTADTTQSVSVNTQVIVEVAQKTDSLSKINQVDSTKNLQLTQEPAIITDPGTGNAPELQVVKSSASMHTVEPKETLYAIAKIYGVGVMDLVTWNNLDLQQGIKIGQVLRVAPPEIIAEAVKTSEIIHEVGPSDTLYSIARKYGVTIKDVMDWTEKQDFAISAGEKLKIKQAQ